MKRNILFVLLMILISGGYLLGMKFLDTHKNNGEKPVITLDSDVITLKVKDNESKLLQGVHASDAEDGDVSSNVIVENISTFDENNERTITYAVFDNDGNVTRINRTLKYKDYKEPEITLANALCFYYYPGDEEAKKYVTATSMIDGDISNQVIVENVEYEKTGGTITYSITDSCGSRVEESYHFTFTSLYISNEIKLSEYLVHMSEDDYLDVRDMIVSIDGPMGNLNDRIDDVDINDPVDTSTPGTYEVTFTLTTEDGSFGMTKLVVIVDE